MELSITEDAANEFKKSVEDEDPQPYLRVGAVSYTHLTLPTKA